MIFGRKKNRCFINLEKNIYFNNEIRKINLVYFKFANFSKEILKKNSEKNLRLQFFYFSKFLKMIFFKNHILNREVKIHIVLYFYKYLDPL